MFDSLVDKIVGFFWYLLWLLGTLIARILQLLYTMFRVYAGMDKITYNESQDVLLNVFFSNSTINIIYSGMAVIGIVLLIVFTIFAVTRKAFDLGDKMQQPMSEILRKALTSFLFIISMNLIVTATVELSNRLLTSIEYLFDNVYAIQADDSIVFTDDQFATMARIFDTIGDFSLNPSASSRYNINECYNEIRPELYRLETQRVFNYTYDVVVDGVPVESWQSVLAQIARAHDLTEEQPLDQYSDAISSALNHAMTYVRVNRDNMTVLTKYEKGGQVTPVTETRMDVMLFLSSTSEAAHNKAYNGTKASFYDPVRRPYLEGKRDMYSESSVKQDFSIAMPEYQHFIMIFGGAMLCMEFLALILNCTGRIFNMLLLYIIAPPFIAAAPFDDGSRFKQWSTAFVIQTFAIFGTILSVRLLLIFIPIVFGSELIMFENGFANMLSKMVLVLGATYTAEKASGLLTGILAENAAMQSIMASDTATSLKNSALGAFAMAAPAALAAGGAKAVLGAAGTVVKGVENGARSLSKRGKQNDNAEKLKNDLAGSDGENAARNFLDMDKQSAMQRYGLSSDKYDDMRAGLGTRLRNGWNSDNPTKTPPDTKENGGKDKDDGSESAGGSDGGIKNLRNMGSDNDARQDGVNGDSASGDGNSNGPVNLQAMMNNDSNNNGGGGSPIGGGEGGSPSSGSSVNGGPQASSQPQNQNGSAGTSSNGSQNSGTSISSQRNSAQSQGGSAGGGSAAGPSGTRRRAMSVSGGSRRSDMYAAGSSRGTQGSGTSISSGAASSGNGTVNNRGAGGRASGTSTNNSAGVSSNSGQGTSSTSGGSGTQSSGVNNYRPVSYPGGYGDSSSSAGTSSSSGSGTGSAGALSSGGSADSSVQNMSSMGSQSSSVIGGSAGGAGTSSEVSGSGVNISSNVSHGTDSSGSSAVNYGNVAGGNPVNYSAGSDTSNSNGTSGGGTQNSSGNSGGSATHSAQDFRNVFGAERPASQSSAQSSGTQSVSNSAGSSQIQNQASAARQSSYQSGGTQSVSNSAGGSATHSAQDFRGVFGTERSSAQSSNQPGSAQVSSGSTVSSQPVNQSASVSQNSYQSGGTQSVSNSAGSHQTQSQSSPVHQRYDYSSEPDDSVTQRFNNLFSADTSSRPSGSQSSGTQSQAQTYSQPASSQPVNTASASAAQYSEPVQSGSNAASSGPASASQVSSGPMANTAASTTMRNEGAARQNRFNRKNPPKLRRGRK